MFGVAVKPIELTILQALEPGMRGQGYEIVRIQVQGSERPTLEIIIDRLDHQSVGINDCVAASNYASTVLDVIDPFEKKYTLNVFSPGEERPLTRISDFERFQGAVAKITLSEAQEGKKRIVGFIESVDSSEVKLRLVDSNELILISFEDIFQARLVVNHGQDLDKKRKKG